jgi:hypothetical protein
VEKGEAVAVPPPMTHKDFLRISGMTEAQLRHCMRVAQIVERGIDERSIVTEQRRRTDKVEKAVVRELHRKLHGRP